MRVLVACEFSGVVREAFRRRGHDAWSCDLLPAEDGSPFHIRGDVRRVLWHGWDLLIAHPPCTRLAVSGARWFHLYREEQDEALAFVRALLDAPIHRIALENPVSVISTRIRKPDQIVQPWMFGHPETKATCLWLKNLPALVPTNDVSDQLAGLPKSLRNRVHYASPGPERWKERSRTLVGLAEAMAAQWGNLAEGCPSCGSRCAVLVAVPHWPYEPVVPNRLRCQACGAERAAWPTPPSLPREHGRRHT